MTDNRFAAIDGILTPPKRPAPRLASVTTDAPPDEPTPETPKTEPSAKRTSARKAPVSQTTGGTRRVVFRLSADLHQALTAHVLADKTSQSHVVLDALEDAHRQGALGDLIAAAQAKETGGGLFTRPKRRGRAEPTVPVEIRIDAGALTQIDNLVNDHHAATRTELITTALRHHLDVGGKGEAYRTSAGDPSGHR